MTFISEYSPLPGTSRSYEERAELDEPCTSRSTGRAGSPGRGAPARLRHRLSFTSPLLAQYSAFQIGASFGCAAPTPPAPVVCAPAGAVRVEARPAPTPKPAPLR